LAVVETQAVAAQADAATPPRVFLLDARQLASAKARLREGDVGLSPAMQQLERDAQEALKAGPFSITDKSMMPPSGDRHDYMSMAPYYWPDPASSNGLPYIRRDGERNPEIGKIPDHRTMDAMAGTVETLALAYYFKGDETYAAKATELLRAWFLDPATRMNSNLQYAQAVTGVNNGRGIGIIESRSLTRVVDSVGLLEGSKSWTDLDDRGVKEWFAKYLQWLQESANGRAEAAAANNHGTYYDVQVVSFALFLGKKEWATEVVKAARTKRIAVQIEPDGRQPLELGRTRAWGYSVGNLSGLVLLATLGDGLGVDLWSYQTPDGRSIRKALDYLVPFAMNQKKWPYQQLGEWPPEALYPVMRRASIKYNDAELRALVARLPAQDASSRSNLLSPRAAEHAQSKPAS
jgi:hypothetical protein